MQKSNIIIAAKKDYAALITVWESSVRATHHFLSEADIQGYKKSILNQYFDQLDLYYIRDQHKILGFLGLSVDLIQMLFILPEARGKGIGKILLQYAVEEKKMNKVDVNEQNTQAFGFYKHLGFSIIDRYEHDALGKAYPILSMEKQ